MHGGEPGRGGVTLAAPAAPAAAHERYLYPAPRPLRLRAPLTPQPSAPRLLPRLVVRGCEDPGAVAGSATATTGIYSAAGTTGGACAGTNRAGGVAVEIVGLGSHRSAFRFGIEQTAQPRKAKQHTRVGGGRCRTSVDLWSRLRARSGLSRFMRGMSPRLYRC
jgi:hypothetical protein